MTITKNNKLRVKMSNGTVEMEILKLTAAGVNARDIRKAGQDPLVTGYTAYGRILFWEMVKNGGIEII